MATKAAQGGASALPNSSCVVPIRKGGKTPRRNPEGDARTIAARGMLDGLRDCGGEDKQAIWAMAEGLRRQLPTAQLRCIHSTLDARNDFDLRCLELEAMRAEHDAERARLHVIAAREGIPWWDSEEQRPRVAANNDQWDHYRARLVDLAETPAHTRHQADRKRALIGKLWLRCEGEFYDRLRGGVAADDAAFPLRGKREGGK